ncbi:RNA cytidine acetyltransferase 1 [Vitis vinifera]|uniref:RNA cytidine acetyltransferase 1 n=1 Tax=Vitis vinifera TaxID=29760 RepID=A0A438KJN3_VITVI|nr:RNA cytidine acetyltransferase 1 [Vitis vinifera]
MKDKSLAINGFHLKYFEGQLTPISEIDVENTVETPHVRVTEAAEKVRVFIDEVSMPKFCLLGGLCLQPLYFGALLFQVSLLEENIKPRTDLPHLLVHLHERRPEKLHYIGVSFGLTLDLFRFWRRHKFAPFYIGQIQSTVTGEHTCMVLKPLNNDEIEVSGSDQDPQFMASSPLTPRFQAKLLCFSILDPKINFQDVEPTMPPSNGFLTSLNGIFSPHDMKRLEAYTNNLADFHMILDLVPILVHQYYQEKLPVTLSYAQASVLLCIGLQNQNISYIEGEIKLERQQILSLFIKSMKKLHKYLYGIASKEIESTLPRLREIVMEPHNISVDEDLNDAAKQVEDGMKAKTESLLDPDFLQQYAIADREADFEKALQNGGGKLPSSGLISVKSSRTKMEKHGKQEKSHKSGEKRSKDHHSSKSNKKRKS